MEVTVQVSRVLRPRGIRGELKCGAFDAPEVIFIDGRTHKVIKSSQSGGFTFLFIQGVDTIDEAEKLRGKEISVSRDDVAVDADEILTSDLIGFEVVWGTGQVAGRIEGVDDFGAGPLINVRAEGRGFSVPYQDIFVEETNMKTRRLVLTKAASSLFDSEIV